MTVFDFFALTIDDDDGTIVKPADFATTVMLVELLANWELLCFKKLLFRLNFFSTFNASIHHLASSTAVNVPHQRSLS